MSEFVTLVNAAADPLTWKGLHLGISWSIFMKVLDCSVVPVKSEW